jgi:hypothetical protein
LSEEFSFPRYDSEQATPTHIINGIKQMGFINLIDKIIFNELKNGKEKRII